SRRRRPRSHTARSCPAGTVTRRMARTGEKPYRVYRGGRTRGKVPLSGRDGRDGRRAYRSDGGGPGRQVVRRPSRWTWRRRLLVALVVCGVLLVAWAAAGYFSVRSGASAAHTRLPAG